MLAQFPWYAAPVVFLVDLALIVGIVMVVRKSGGAAGTLLGLLLGWFALASAVAPSAPTPNGTTPLSMRLLLVVPIVVSLVLLGQRGWRDKVASLPVPSLIRLQMVRVIGALFLPLAAAGVLPRYFAETAAYGDIMIAVTAPLVAFIVTRGVTAARPIALAWTTLGVLDLVIAVGLGAGFLVPILHPEISMVPVAAGAIAVYPLVLIPTFLVPLCVVLHLYSGYRLVSKKG